MAPEHKQPAAVPRSGHRRFAKGEGLPVAVVGAGFIGVEVALLLRALGVAVTVTQSPYTAGSSSITPGVPWENLRALIEGLAHYRQHGRGA